MCGCSQLLPVRATERRAMGSKPNRRWLEQTVGEKSLAHHTLFGSLKFRAIDLLHICVEHLRGLCLFTFITFMCVS